MKEKLKSISNGKKMLTELDDSHRLGLRRLEGLSAGPGGLGPGGLREEHLLLVEHRPHDEVPGTRRRREGVGGYGLGKQWPIRLV